MKKSKKFDPLTEVYRAGRHDGHDDGLTALLIFLMAASIVALLLDIVYG